MKKKFLHPMFFAAIILLVAAAAVWGVYNKLSWDLILIDKVETAYNEGNAEKFQSYFVPDSVTREEAQDTVAQGGTIKMIPCRVEMTDEEKEDFLSSTIYEDVKGYNVIMALETSYLDDTEIQPLSLYLVKFGGEWYVYGGTF